MNGTISYKDLREFYLNNEEAKTNAKKYFGTMQPSFHQIGYYSSPSWNWSYQIGITCLYSSDWSENKYFEVVTQFGEVKAARQIYMPIMEQN
jgi:hypothetical protein